jgi:hypothetical protein
LTEVLAAAAFVPVGIIGVGIRSGTLPGCLVFAAVIFLAILLVEAIIELPHHPFSSGVQG